jgi:hypothetical protein
MMDSNGDSPDRAGTAVLHAAMLQARHAGPDAEGTIDDAGYRALLAEARRNLEETDPNIKQHRYAAAKTALEALEAIERGDDILNALEIFKGHVEAICGGERTFDLGGRRIKNKPSVNVSYLRAAAYVLWNRNIARGQLELDAQSLLGFSNRAQLRKFVYNSTNLKPDGSGMPQSSIWVHIPIIEDLIDNHGYKALTDFV